MDTTSTNIIVKTITLSGILGVVLSACSNVTVAQNSTQQLNTAGERHADTQILLADAESATSPGTPVRESSGTQLSLREESDLVFNILAAEIAGRRGLVEIASQNYFDASVATDDPRVSERAVKLALFSRDWQQAALASARWVELAASDIEAWQHHAQATMQLGDVNTATAAMEQVVTLSDNDPGAVMPAMVDTILRQTDTEVGSQLLERLAERYPNNADTQYGIGRFAMSRGERELALQAFERALAIDPDNIDTLLSRARLQLGAGEGDGALVPITGYLARMPDDLSAQLGYARLLIDTGRVDLAADQFEVIYQNFPTDSDALYTIGLLALDNQRLKSAENYLLTVVDLDQHLDNSYYYLGRISENRKDYQEAINRYQNVRGGDNFFNSQMRAAQLYGMLGRVEDGRELFTTLRSLSDEKTVQIELINAESQMLNSNALYEESFTVLTEGLDQYNDDPALLYSRALVAERLDRRELFESDLKTVIEVQPENSYALNALGYFLTDRNERLSEAEIYLTKAHKLSPEDAAITDSLGWLYYRQGRYAESIELLRSAYEMLPDSEIAAHLGEVLWVSGEQSQATKVWEGALRDAPDDDLLNSVMKKYIR